jgi:hypothetical protein
MLVLLWDPLRKESMPAFMDIIVIIVHRKATLFANFLLNQGRDHADLPKKSWPMPTGKASIIEITIISW